MGGFSIYRVISITTLFIIIIILSIALSDAKRDKKEVARHHHHHPDAHQSPDAPEHFVVPIIPEKKATGAAAVDDRGNATIGKKNVSGKNPGPKGGFNSFATNNKPKESSDKHLVVGKNKQGPVASTKTTSSDNPTANWKKTNDGKASANHQKQHLSKSSAATKAKSSPAPSRHQASTASHHIHHLHQKHDKVHQHTHHARQQRFDHRRFKKSEESGNTGSNDELDHRSQLAIANFDSSEEAPEGSGYERGDKDSRQPTGTSGGKNEVEGQGAERGGNSLEEMGKDGTRYLTPVAGPYMMAGETAEGDGETNTGESEAEDIRRPAFNHWGEYLFSQRSFLMADPRKTKKSELGGYFPIMNPDEHFRYMDRLYEEKNERVKTFHKMYMYLKQQGKKFVIPNYSDRK